MGRNFGNLVEFALEPVGGAQRGRAQRVRRFEHEQRLLAFGKHAIEFARGLRHRIAGHDQRSIAVSVGIRRAP